MRTIVRIAGAGAALTLCPPIAGAAAADVPEPVVPETRSWTAVEDDGTLVEITVGPATEPTIRPDPGEVVVTETATAVTTYTGVTRSCTETVTAQKPDKWNGNARSIVTGKRSAGCAGSKVFTGKLWSKGTLWSERGVKSNAGVTAAMEVSFSVTKACKSTSSTTWRGGAFFGYEGSATNSSDVALACSP